MSLLFQGSYTGLRRFNDMPSAFPTFTICGFAKLNDGPAAGINTLLSVMDSGGNSGSELAVTTSNGLYIATGWGSDTSSAVATLSEGGASGTNWFFWCWRSNGFGTNSTRLYFRNLSGGTIAYLDIDHDAFGSPAWGDFVLGRHLFADENQYSTYTFNGWLAHLKLYNAVLSDAEVESESYSLSPVRTSDLLSYHTFSESTLSACYSAQQGTGTWNVYNNAPSLSTDNPVLTSWPTLGGSDTLPSESSSGAAPVNMFGGWTLPSTRALPSTSQSSVIVAPHSNMQTATDVAVITYPISAKRVDGTAISFTKTQTISKVKSGTSGTIGTQGPRGATAIAIQMASGVSAWSAAAAEAEMQSQGLWPPVRNDRVTQYNSTFTKTFFYAGTGTYSAANWLELLVYIDGNAVITGTLSGNAIISNTLTADKLTIGAAGAVPNMLKNSDWVEINRYPANDPLSLKDWVFWHNGVTTRDGYRRHPDYNYGLGGLWLSDSSQVGAGVAQYVYQDLAAEQGISYEFSAYMVLHRCVGYIYLQWFGAGDTNLGTTALDAYTSANAGTGTIPSDPTKSGGAGGVHNMAHFWGKATAPAGTVKVRFHIVKHTTNAGASPASSYLFAQRAMVCKAPPSSSVSNRTAWNDGGVTTIDGGAIVTNSITAATGAIADAAITSLKIAGESATIIDFIQFPGPWNWMQGQNGGQAMQNQTIWGDVFTTTVPYQRVQLLLNFIYSVLGGGTNIGGNLYFRINFGSWQSGGSFNLSSMANFNQDHTVFFMLNPTPSGSYPQVAGSYRLDIMIDFFNDWSSGTGGIPLVVNVLALASMR